MVIPGNDNRFNDIDIKQMLKWLIAFHVICLYLFYFIFRFREEFNFNNPWHGLQQLRSRLQLQIFREREQTSRCVPFVYLSDNFSFFIANMFQHKIIDTNDNITLDLTCRYISLSTWSLLNSFDCVICVTNILISSSLYWRKYYAFLIEQIYVNYVLASIVTGRPVSRQRATAKHQQQNQYILFI